MAERQDATDLLDAVAVYTPPPTDDRVAKIGVVVTATVNGAGTVSTCTIRFDGETVVGGKQYPCLSSYIPKVGDRVIVQPVGSVTSWLVVGALNSIPALTLPVSSDGTAGLTFQNGNSNNSGRSALARSDRLVTLQVATTDSNGTAVDETIMTVPAGYRPAVEWFFQVGIYGGMGGGWSGHATMSVKPTGEVQPKFITGGSIAGAQFLGSTTYIFGS